MHTNEQVYTKFKSYKSKLNAVIVKSRFQNIAIKPNKFYTNKTIDYQQI